MIKTIIFDLGGIYFIEKEWLDMKEANQFFKEEYNKCALSSEKSRHFWIKMKKRLGTPDSWENIRKSFLDSINPNHQIIRLIRNLRKSGYKVFYLSNSHIDIHPYLDAKCNFSKEFDGGILSHEHSFHKPEKEIYIELLDTTKMKPNETIYIDDIEENLKPAKELGMTVLLFRNASELAKDLQELGIKNTL